MFRISIPTLPFHKRGASLRDYLTLANRPFFPQVAAHHSVTSVERNCEAENGGEMGSLTDENKGSSGLAL